jgi:S-adenosyl-L-methionine hydrolase (adenosine-forming)
VFLLTDYGNSDEFAGVLRAVVVRDAPGATVSDLTHGVPPFDVRAGALALERSALHLGPGVVVAVVDPDVGGDRRAVAVEVRGWRGPRHLVGPDNGLLPWAVDALGGVRRAVELDTALAGASTFDGRDRFAPAAARLWAGAPLDGLGPAVDHETLVRLPFPVTVVAPGRVTTEVVWIDRFGNVQLAAGAPHAEQAGISSEATLELAGRRTPLRRVDAFTDIGDDEIGLVVDANRRLALCARRGAAATTIGARVGDVAVLSP